MADIDEPLANPPIDLPPFNNIVNLPPRPQNPPVSRDVVSGHKYEKDMVVAHGMQNPHDSYYREYLQVFRSVAEGLVSDDHLADTFTYTLSLVQGRAGAGMFNSLVVFSLSSRLFTTAAAPAWFHVAMQQALQPINDRLDRLMTLTTKALRLCAIVRMLTFRSPAVPLISFIELQLTGRKRRCTTF